MLNDLITLDQIIGRYESRNNPKYKKTLEVLKKHRDKITKKTK